MSELCRTDQHLEDITHNATTNKGSKLLDIKALSRKKPARSSGLKTAGRQTITLRTNDGVFLSHDQRKEVESDL